MSFNAKLNRPVHLAILTISDTRTEETDKGGLLIAALAKQAKIKIKDKIICKDEVQEITKIIEGWYRDPTIDCIITTGGTGIAKRDLSIEAISTTFSKEIPGFGELFRYLSFVQDVGSKAMLSRAAAGIVHGKVVFILPGSTKAVELAMTELILPEIEHIIYELTK